MVEAAAGITIVAGRLSNYPRFPESFHIERGDYEKGHDKHLS